jgi:hypothetical protein
MRRLVNWLFNRPLKGVGVVSLATTAAAALMQATANDVRRCDRRGDDHR